MAYFKAFIRVVKSLKNEYGYESFGQTNIIEERLIEAENKDEVKKHLIDKYPQFFPTNKVYEKETKDTAQFFYVIIYPLWEHELNIIKEGEWSCCVCGQKYKNKYEFKPYVNDRVWGDKLFCNKDVCEKKYISDDSKLTDMPDDLFYVKKDSPNYIYKITEKSTGKFYIGKTRNAPFFRWWNHLTKSSSPFGAYLSKTTLKEWTFEVIDILPGNVSDSIVFALESKYITEFDSIKNGFNKVLSKKIVDKVPDLFE